MTLAITYTIIAILATAINIGAQELTLHFYGGSWSVAMSVFIGTAAGLITKYVLDKAFIFKFQARNALHDAQVFAVYTATGAATTALFWAFEFGFNEIFESKAMRYVGALLGLALGYFIKYQLDKRFAFRGSIDSAPRL